MGFTLWLCLTVCELENGPVEIVDLPINSMVDFSSALCKRLPEGIWGAQVVFVAKNNGIHFSLFEVS